MLLLYPSLLLSVYSVFEGLEWNTWRANGRNIRCFSDTWGMRVSSFQFTHLVKHFINNTLQSHLLCLNIMLWQAVSNRLSFGMTPKTVRLPKNGEMLLSVHGSPLGVYKEENLAAIQGIHHVLLLIFLYRKPHLVLSCQVIIFLLPESGNGDGDAPCWCTRCTSKKVGVID